MHTKLLSILEVADTFQRTYPDDACLVVGDREKIIAYYPGKEIDLKIPVGKKMENEKTVTVKAIRQGKSFREERGPEVYGIPYISTATPIYDNNEIIGVISAVISNTRFDTLRTQANELSSAVQQMSATTEEVTHAANDASTQLQDLTNETTSITKDVEEIKNIIGLVKNLATQSNILGLNASIEAARSGEHGRGFAVVAKEIRKMSAASNEAVEKIQNQLDQIERSLGKFTDTTQHFASFTEEHSASMQELNSTFTQISASADKLINVSS